MVSGIEMGRLYIATDMEMPYYTEGIDFTISITFHDVTSNKCTLYGFILTKLVVRISKTFLFHVNHSTTSYNW